MASFEKCMTFVAHWEGGWSDDAQDPGGATKYGVSLKWLKDLARQGEQVDFNGDGEITVKDIQLVSPFAAAKMFKKEFWDRGQLDKFPNRLALSVFDMAVNCGYPRAYKQLQKGLNLWNGAELRVDGVIGPKTLQAIFALEAPTMSKFVDYYDNERRAFYKRLVIDKPELGKFLKGWLNRVSAIAPYSVEAGM
ncbi:MAG: glycosyl hydrolase 108 family protein [Aurantimicrobium sp.]